MAAEDEFTGASLGASWTFVDPVGDCSVSVADSRVSIVAPSGTAHVTDNSSNSAPYIYQAQSDVDGDWQAKFDSAPRRGTQVRFQGVILYDSAGADRVAIITYDLASTTNIFVFSNVGGSGQIHANTNLGSAAPSHLRINRTGDVWTCYSSPDGSTWTQRAQFTRAMTVTRAGILGGNSAPNPAHTTRADWWHVGTPSVPSAPSTTNTTVWTEAFTGDDNDPPSVVRWVTDSAVNGSATIQSNQLRLRHTNESGSRGGVYTVAAQKNLGVLLKYTFGDIDNPPHWFVPGFSAQQTPTASGGGGGNAEGYDDIYSPGWGYMLEVGGENDLAKPFRVDESGIADGTYVFSTYVQLDEVTATSQITARWLRMERLQDVADARGLWRGRTWADGDSEPGTWDYQVWDGVNDAPGRLYLPYASDAQFASAPPTRDLLIDQVTLYTIAEAAAVQPTPASRTYTVPAESRSYTVPAEDRTYTVPAEDRTVTVV